MSNKVGFPFKGLLSSAALSCIAAVLLPAGNAFAQAPAGAASDPKAQGAADSGDIIVTAQRRSESLQKVPIAITAVPLETIENLSLRNIDKVALVTPGLVFDTGYSYTLIYIRGVGDVSPGVGLETPVATYYDGAYLQRITGTAFDLMDVSSVEVLKGPQGTLYGRNATGGAVLVNTANPTQDFGLSGAAEVGRFDHSQIDARLNVPLSDNFAVRFAGRYRHDGGFLKNVVTGDRVRGKTAYDARIKARWTPTSDLTATMLFEYQREVGTANAAGRQEVQPPFCVGCAASPVAFTDFYQVAEDFRRKDRMRSYNANLTVEYDFGQMTLKSLTAYRDVAAGITDDSDHTGAPLFVFDASYGGKTFQQDLNLNSSFDGAFNFLAGASYLRDDASQRSLLYGSLFGAPYNGVTRPVNRPEGNQAQLTKSYSAFAEVYVKPVDRLTVTLGGRYTHDTRYLDSHINALGVQFNNPGGPLDFVQRAKYSKFTPRAVIAYDAGVVNLYASYTRGFRAGGFNTPSWGPLRAPILPETMDSYELGAKYVSPDGRTRASLALFRYDYKDVLVSIVNNSVRIVTNAASARGKGVELDVNHRFSDWLTMNAGGTYLDAHYTDYPNASQFVYRRDAQGNITGLMVGTVDLSGTRLPRAPKWTAFIGANVEAPLSGDWIGRLNIAGRYSSKYLFIAGASGVLGLDYQSPMFLANMSGGVGPRDGSYELGFYIDNLTDKKYYGDKRTGTLGVSSLPSLPRTYGLRFKFKY
ncbi:outer membrane receptor protein [Sphingobium fuliginis]|uniref:Outer membrane receptor protein n=1 Tax=Sphingobium fuliginis (strain ATCC 27551) TaxID=336203 RepID=A0A292ZHD0_SPHSA|nr:outer membrane receptor protein [Sphingobium fuliginis]